MFGSISNGSFRVKIWELVGPSGLTSNYTTDILLRKSKEHVSMYWKVGTIVEYLNLVL